MLPSWCYQMLTILSISKYFYYLTYVFVLATIASKQINETLLNTVKTVVDFISFSAFVV